MNKPRELIYCGSGKDITTCGYCMRMNENGELVDVKMTPLVPDPPPKRKIIHGTKREGQIVFCAFLFLVLGYLLSVLYVFYYGGNNV